MSDWKDKLIRYVLSEQLDPIDAAIASGEVEVNECCASGWTMLMYATKYGCDKTMDFLIAKGADVNLQSSIGETALHIAARHRGHTYMKTLLEAGALPNVQDIYGKTATMTIAMFSMTSGYNETNDILNRLVEAKADMNIQDCEGCTAIMYFMKMKAADDEWINTAEIIMNAGADVKLKNNYNETVFNMMNKEDSDIFQQKLEEIKAIEIKKRYKRQGEFRRFALHKRNL